MALRARDNELIVVDTIQFDIPKTKQMMDTLRVLGLYGESCLIVIPQKDENVWKSSAEYSVRESYDEFGAECL
ncbi:MAG: 50S ribosomal protein L4 [Candidatus Brocadia fulgida]|uniref:50S ribosomal protein L4 n=1 Tax=Candidatus Brocadia fulgida TaxID=380242 RepID=A0A0M2UUU7_9BACT|nr:MAG: 50S ribosomal protein L4 [Candidatus Brocadia fulgida]